MFIARLTSAVCVTIIWAVVTSSAFALSLDEAKANGLVGEKANGYLGAVNPANAEAQVLIEEVNQKRRQAYEDIAKRNGTNVQAVQRLAGEKAIQNTKPGNFVEGPGGWMKK
ncbi:MAG: YdbL family protein [Nitrospira sp.]|nr:YdbL family protein [Nitrospira sp.]MDH4250828.1 YdbL family protein [Nitrospira sp.]MDH4343002.1 YdbL family protein [Nitrospira sp.]MDH5336684.1 YdbL family protein [Nitrospira sp.]